MNRAALVAASVALAACAGPPPLTDCRAPLAGVWREDDSERHFHILDDGARVRIYPMFDDSELHQGVRFSPAVFQLERHGATIDGSWHFRTDDAGHLCEIYLPARITACAGPTIELEHHVLAGPDGPGIDLRSCEHERAPHVRTRVLRRGYVPGS